METEDIHATAVFLKPLENLAIYDADPLPRLELPASKALASGPWIAAHPGSGSEKKNWPEEKWRELLRSVVGQAGQRILLVGGEAEGDRLSRLAREFSAEQVRVAQGLPLAELGARLKSCQLFLGHDSGISHLAAAVGVPVLALWGPSRPEIWRPPHPHVRLLSTPGGLENLGVAEVETAVRELLG